MVLSDNSGGDIGWKKWLIAGWAFMECLFFGGLLYGWGSIVFVLKNEGVYADMCEQTMDINNSTNTTGTGMEVVVVPFNSTLAPQKEENLTASGQGQSCVGQDENMALCFTIGSAMFCVGCAILGHVSFKFGTRVTRLIAFVLFEAGALLLAFTSKEVPWLMFPGLSLLGIGGLPILVTNAQISNLFVVGSSAVVGLFSGAFDTSSSVMLLVKLLSDNEITTRQTMFIIIAVSHLLVLVSTFFFLPKTVIQKTMSRGTAQGQKMTGETATELLPKDPEIEFRSTSENVPTLLECLKNPSFLTHVIWLMLLQLRFFYFMGTLNQYLNTVLKEDKDLVSYFTNVCFYTMMSGLVFAFLSGLVYDFQKWMCRNGKSKAYRETMPAVLPLTIASFLSVLMSILVLIPNPSVLYLTFIVLTVHRSFLYSLAAGFLSALFPSDYFGLLYGVMIVCGGAFGCFQFGFFTWSKAYDGGMSHANICLLILVCLSFIHPICLFYRSWRVEKEKRSEAENITY